VALNRLTGHSPGFSSADAASRLFREGAIENQCARAPRRRGHRRLIKKSRAFLAEGAPRPQLVVADAAHLQHIADATVDLVVTSPPFLDVVDYRGDNWLRNWFAGIDVESIRLSQHRAPEDGRAMTRDVFAELARVVKPGGHVAYEVGEVRGGALPLEQLVWRALDDLPFERLGVLVNEQSFTKTSNCWGVANNVKGVNSNRIVIARRF
jgi:hypothetical protein